MKITIGSTTKVVTLNGIDCRVWEGETERGVKIHVYSPHIAVEEFSSEDKVEKVSLPQRMRRV